MSRLIKGLIKDVAKDTATAAAEEAAYSAVLYETQPQPQPQPQQQSDNGDSYATYRGCTCNCPISQDGGLFGRKKRKTRKPLKTIKSSSKSNLTNAVQGAVSSGVQRASSSTGTGTKSMSGCSCTCPVAQAQYGGAVNDMTVKQLREAAKIMQINGRSQLKTKDQLKTAILKKLRA